MDVQQAIYAESDSSNNTTDTSSLSHGVGTHVAFFLRLVCGDFSHARSSLGGHVRQVVVEGWMEICWWEMGRRSCGGSSRGRLRERRLLFCLLTSQRLLHLYAQDMVSALGRVAKSLRLWAPSTPRMELEARSSIHGALLLAAGQGGGTCSQLPKEEEERTKGKSQRRRRRTAQL